MAGARDSEMLTRDGRHRWEHRGGGQPDAAAGGDPRAGLGGPGGIGVVEVVCHEGVEGLDGAEGGSRKGLREVGAELEAGGNEGVEGESQRGGGGDPGEVRGGLGVEEDEDKQGYGMLPGTIGEGLDAMGGEGSDDEVDHPQEGAVP